MPGEQGQQALLAWFNEGDTRAYKIRFPNGTVDVFRGFPRCLPVSQPPFFCINGGPFCPLLL